MKTLVLVFIFACCLMLTSCGSDPNATTDLREYKVNNLYSVVGVGRLDADNKLHVKCYNGAIWNQQQSDKVEVGPVTLDSFGRAR